MKGILKFKLFSLFYLLSLGFMSILPVKVFATQQQSNQVSAETVAGINLKDKNGNVLPDVVNFCYLDWDDESANAQLIVMLSIDITKADSVFGNCNNVRVEFLDSDENVQFKNSSSFEPKQTFDGANLANLRDCNFYIDRSLFQFGKLPMQKYELKFYNADIAESNDENLLATCEFEVLSPDEASKYVEASESEVKAGHEEEQEVDNKLLNKSGEKISDFLNLCYVDSKDGDSLGKLVVTLFANKNATDSVFINRDKVRVDFLDADGNLKLTKQAACKNPVGEDGMHVNEFEVDKFELKFGQAYTLKFYDENAEASDDNLLAIYELEIAKSENDEAV